MDFTHTLTKEGAAPLAVKFSGVTGTGSYREYAYGADEVRTYAQNGHPVISKESLNSAKKTVDMIDTGLDEGIIVPILEPAF